MLKQTVTGNESEAKTKTAQFYKDYQGLFSEKIEGNLKRYQSADTLYRWCVPYLQLLSIIKKYFDYTIKEDQAVDFFKLLCCYKQENKLVKIWPFLSSLLYARMGEIHNNVFKYVKKSIKKFRNREDAARYM